MLIIFDTTLCFLVLLDAVQFEKLVSIEMNQISNEFKREKDLRSKTVPEICHEFAFFNDEDEPVHQ